MTITPEELAELRKGWVAGHMIVAGQWHEAVWDDDRMAADIEALVAEKTSTLRRALAVVDEEYGCCAPGDWCHFKTYSELAVDYVKDVEDAKAEARREALVEAVRYLREDCDVVSHTNTYAGDDGDATLKAAADGLAKLAEEGSDGT